MSSGPRHPRAAAIDQARALIAMVRDVGAPWTVVGSLRRGAADVGDVEHVAIGCLEVPAVESGLFGERLTSGDFGRAKNLLLERLDALVVAGKLVKAVKSDGRTRWGDRYRAVCLPGSTLQQEIYIADALNIGSLLAIRTGPRQFSVMLQTLLLEHGYRNHEGYVYRVQRKPCPAGGFEEVIYGDIVAVPTEVEYFRLAGMKAVEIPPGQREAVAAHFWRARGRRI